jgi:DNA-binding PadR family transcriptional regulator
MYFAYMDRDSPPGPVDEALPLRPRDFLVLLVLAGGDLHGYAIMKEVERQSGGRVRLEVGSLYRTIARLLDAGLIEEPAGDPPAEADEERRRPYRISPYGRRVARREAERLVDVLELARARGLLELPGKAP